MNILIEFRQLVVSIVKWGIAFLILAAFFFALGPKIIHVWGREALVPWASDRTFSVVFFDKMHRDLIPPDVKLIVTNPFDAFLIEMKVALFLAFIVTLPIILFALLKYLSPALKQSEKRALYKVVIPSFILFLGGCIFAYMLIIPATTRILYSYTPGINALPYYTIDDFISLAFTLMTMTGLMFLMPIFMTLSAYIGVIKYSFWKKYWRYVIFGFVVFTAVITPDGSGITMIMLTIPLCVLYISGMLLSRRYG